jgi:hypothetical protein
VKQTGGSIRVYDRDEKQIRGATLDNMAQQLVDAIVQDLDSSLSATMDTEVLTKKSPTVSATAITYDELLNAMSITRRFGVDYDTFSGIAVHSHVIAFIP